MSINKTSTSVALNADVHRVFRTLCAERNISVNLSELVTQMEFSLICLLREEPVIENIDFNLNPSATTLLREVFVTYNKHMYVPRRSRA